jgi:LPPG:FO 2-phospho-L-lactate transferase
VNEPSDKPNAIACPFERIVVLSGGVGGARMVDGLYRSVPKERLTAIVNTGDDFKHWGLYICPDVDTVLYTLSGLGDQERGWGLRGDSFRALGMVAFYGGDNWFQLGDQDLATHLMRSRWLKDGETLTQVTARLAGALGVECSVLPMSDFRLETKIDTESDGTLGLQDWLVRRRAEPRVRRVRFEGQAQPTPEVLTALSAADLIVLAPSNPYVSIDPILSLPGVRDQLFGRRVVAVSPIVGGAAIKGPLAEMISALAHRPASAAAVASHYGGLLTGMVVERGDERDIAGIKVLGTDTVMRGRRGRKRLARELIEFAETLGAR